MSTDLLPEFIRTHYEVHEWKHACAILKQDFVNEWNDIVSVLTEFRLMKSWIVNPGGRKSKGFTVHRQLSVSTRVGREGIPNRNGG